MWPVAVRVKVAGGDRLKYLRWVFLFYYFHWSSECLKWSLIGALHGVWDIISGVGVI